MPKAILTRAQAARDQDEAIKQRIADGLGRAKRLDYGSVEKLSAELNIDRRVVSRMLKGDFSGRLQFDQMTRAMAMAQVYNNVCDKNKKGDNIV